MGGRAPGPGALSDRTAPVLDPGAGYRAPTSCRWPSRTGWASSPGARWPGDGCPAGSGQGKDNTSGGVPGSPGRYDLALPANQRKLEIVTELAAVADDAGHHPDRAGPGLRARASGDQRRHHRPRTMEQLEIQLSAPTVRLEPAVLDRIDEIVRARDQRQPGGRRVDAAVTRRRPAPSPPPPVGTRGRGPGRESPDGQGRGHGLPLGEGLQLRPPCVRSGRANRSGRADRAGR